MDIQKYLAHPKVGAKVYNNFLNDYILTKHIDRINKLRYETGSNELITVSTGRKIYDYYYGLRKLQEERLKGPIGYLDSNEVIPLINKAVSAVTSDFSKPVFELDLASAKKYAVDFKRYTFATEKSVLLSDGKMYKGYDYGERGYIPLSPYNKVFRNYETFLRNGPKIGYLANQDIFNADGSPKDEASLIQNPPKLYDIDSTSSYNVSDRGYSELGDFESVIDRSGFSRLIPYMPPNEFNKFKPWIALGSRYGRMSASAIDRAMTILDYVESEGLEYEFRRDLNPGQVKLRLLDSKIDVRLFDPVENGDYVGKCYHDGIIYSLLETSPNANEWAKINHIPSNLEETLIPLKVALNIPIELPERSSYVGVLPDPSRRRRLNTSYYGTNGSMNSQKLVRVVQDDNNRYVNSIFVSASKLSGRRAKNALSPEGANTRLEKAIADARAMFDAEFNLENMLASYEALNTDEPAAFEFSGDELISIIQKEYWGYLHGKSDLANVTYMIDDYEDENKAKLEVYSYPSDDKIENIKAHYEGLVDAFVGNYDKKTMNVVGVSTYWNNAISIMGKRNELIKALRATNEEFSFSGVSGEVSQLKDELVRFNRETSVPMISHESEFYQRMGRVIKEAMLTSGYDVEDENILIDANGVVQYTGKVYEGHVNNAYGPNNGNKPSNFVERTYEMGQIFDVNELGLIETKYNGSANKYIAAGYRAVVSKQLPGQHLSFEARTRLIGYEQDLSRKIRQVISTTATINNKDPEPTILNSVYRKLYKRTIPLNYKELDEQQGRNPEEREAAIKSDCMTIKYPNSFKKGAGINAYLKAKGTISLYSMLNDNYVDPYRDAGKVMAVLSDSEPGYLCPIATGSGANQGVVRTLCSGAKISENGFIEKSEDLNDLSPLMKTDFYKYWYNSPPSRAGMPQKAGKDAIGNVNKVTTAWVTCGGWTFDDGIVISKDLAERQQVLDVDGNLRPLLIGDKFIDASGNKGVIGTIVDRDMDLDLAEEKGVAFLVQIMRLNSELDVVQAPFSSLSRFNGSLYKEASEEATDLILPDNKVLVGGMGKVNYLITDATADYKTKIYTSEDVREGKGRKVSSQLTWALTALEAHELSQYFFKDNVTGINNYREILKTLGLDVTETGELQLGHEEHFNEKANIIEFPEIEFTTNGKVSSVSKKAINKVLINESGYLEIPFPLEYATSSFLTEEEKTRGLNRLPDADKEGKYLLPILPANLRTSQKLLDGTTTIHDYTRYYSSIYESVLEYERELKELGESHSKSSDSYNNKKEALLKNYTKKAQQSFSSLSEKLIQNEIESKHSHAKESLMAVRAPASSTSIVTPNPMLSLDTIAVSKSIYEDLDFTEVDGEKYAIIMRDPLINHSGVKLMKVELDENLQGIALNPIYGKPFAGDFDGDTFGVFAVHDERVIKKTIPKMGVNYNLLNTAVNPDEEGNYPFLIGDGMDLAVAYTFNPELKERYDKINTDYNEARRNNDYEQMDILASELSGISSESLQAAAGNAYMSQSNPEEHIKSLEAQIDMGAKGSFDALATYASLVGITYDTDEEGRPIPGTIKDSGKPYASPEVRAGFEYCESIKSQGTAVAGTVAQMLTRVSRSMPAEYQQAGLNITGNITQGILQAKKDPVHGMLLMETVSSPITDSFLGYKLTYRDDTNKGYGWYRSYDDGLEDENGNSLPDRVSPEGWIDQMTEILTSKETGLGQNVNFEDIKKVAEILTEYDENGKETGYTINAKESISKGASLDLITYSPSFGSTLVELARQNRPVFDGQLGPFLEPRVLAENKKHYEMDHIESMKPLGSAKSRAKKELAPKGVEVDVNKVSERLQDMQRESTVLKAERPQVTLKEPLLNDFKKKEVSVENKVPLNTSTSTEDLNFNNNGLSSNSETTKDVLPTTSGC